MVGKTGGYKEVLKEDTQDKQYINLTFTGQSKSQKVTFKFDLEPPIHCSEENTCCDGSGSCKENSTPLTTLKDITYVSKHITHTHTHTHNLDKLYYFYTVYIHIQNK